MCTLLKRNTNDDLTMMTCTRCLSAATCRSRLTTRSWARCRSSRSPSKSSRYVLTCCLNASIVLCSDRRAVSASCRRLSSWSIHTLFWPWIIAICFILALSCLFSASACIQNNRHSALLALSTLNLYHGAINKKLHEHVYISTPRWNAKIYFLLDIWRSTREQQRIFRRQIRSH